MNGHSRNTHGQPYRPSAVRRDAKDRTIRVEIVKIERKSFELALLKNNAGTYLRVTEDSPGRRSRIIIPAAGLRDFHQLLESFGNEPASDSPQPDAEARGEAPQP